MGIPTAAGAVDVILPAAAVQRKTELWKNIMQCLPARVPI